MKQDAPKLSEDTDTAEPAVVRQTPNITLSIGSAAAPVQMDGARGGKTRLAPSKVEWQSKEFISPDKGPIWYAILAVAVVAIILLDIFVLKTPFTVSALGIVMAIAIVVMHIRPPRMVSYRLDSEGLHANERLYDFTEYKAFGVMHDGKENLIEFIPVKRFRPSLQVYFPVEAGENIVDLVGERLPMQELHPDFVDQLVKMFRL